MLAIIKDMEKKKTKEFINKFKKMNSLFLLAIGFAIGIITMFLLLQPKLLNQEESIKSLSDVVDKNEKSILKLQSDLSGYKDALNIEQLLQKLTPTPQNKQSSAELPEWCNSVIDAWMGQGYSRTLTNQLMKKDHPECTY